MNSILEIILKLPPVIGVSIDSTRKNPQLFPLLEVTYNLQMGYFWLKEANIEMKSMMNSVEITEQGTEEHRLVIPTFIGTVEQLDYMRTNLRELSKGTQEYINDTALPQEVEYKVKQAYNSIMLALFNTELSTSYYGQIERGY